jgi:magnesium transporter
VFEWLLLHAPQLLEATSISTHLLAALAF